jgi:hypothetical protein
VHSACLEYDSAAVMFNASVPILTVFGGRLSPNAHPQKHAVKRSPCSYSFGTAEVGVVSLVATRTSCHRERGNR